MRPLLLALLASALALPAFAAETAWQEIAPDVSIRLISSGVVSATGTSLMAIEIDMPQGTKTYWRVPGETGLPLDLDVKNSSGVGDYTVHWPFPVSQQKDGYLDHVYLGHTVLPMEIKVTDTGGTLDMSATLGICSDICIPAQARFSLPVVDAIPDRASGLRIRQAMAQVPIAWDQGIEPVGDVHMLPDEKTLGVEIAEETVDGQSLIAVSNEGNPLIGLPQKSPQAGLVLLPILGKSDNSALEGEEVELTFMTDQGAYVVNRTISSADDLDAAATE